MSICVSKAYIALPTGHCLWRMLQRNNPSTQAICLLAWPWHFTFVEVKVICHIVIVTKLWRLFFSWVSCFVEWIWETGGGKTWQTQNAAKTQQFRFPWDRDNIQVVKRILAWLLPAGMLGLSLWKRFLCKDMQLATKSGVRICDGLSTSETIALIYSNMSLSNYTSPIS